MRLLFGRFDENNAERGLETAQNSQMFPKCVF